MPIPAPLCLFLALQTLVLRSEAHQAADSAAAVQAAEPGRPHSAEATQPGVPASVQAAQPEPPPAVEASEPELPPTAQPVRPDLLPAAPAPELELQPPAARHEVSDVGLPPSLADALRASGLPPGAVSIMARAPDGRSLAWNGGVVREVGSLIKLLTTLAALERLGPAFRFHTDLLANPDSEHPGRWQVGLRGGGDPGFRYEDLRHLLRAALAAGVKGPLSEMALDASRFAPDQTAASGIRQDPDRVGATPPFPLLVEQAAVQLSLPAGHDGSPLLDPPLPLQVPPAQHSAASQDAAPRSCPPDWLEQLHLDPVPTVPGSAGTGRLTLRGDWPEQCPAGILLRAPLAPAQYLDLALTSAWQELGQHGSLRAHQGVVPSYARVMLSADSRPLADLIRDINKYSNNVMARMLFLDLAAEAGYLPAHTEDGARVIDEWLAAIGLHFPELELENGSGLSHRETVTAEHLQQLLEYALTSPIAPDFVSSLAIPGKEGVLRTRFQGLPGAERMRLKSGTLDGVRALAGFVSDAHGRVGTVVCIVNDRHAELAPALQTALLAWMVSDRSATPAPP